MKNLFAPLIENKNKRSSTISERDDESIISAYSKLETNKSVGSDESVSNNNLNKKTKNYQNCSKQNLPMLTNVIMIMVGVTSISFATSVNRPSYGSIKPEGQELPIFLGIFRICNIIGVLLSRKIYNKDGLKKTLYLCLAMMAIILILNLIYDFLICPDFITYDEYSVTYDKKDCSFKYVPLITYACLQGICESIYIIVSCIIYKQGSDNSNVNPFWLISICEVVYSIPMFLKYLLVQIYSYPFDPEAPTYIISIPLFIVGVICFILFSEKTILKNNVNYYDEKCEDLFLPIKELILSIKKDRTFTKWIILTSFWNLILSFYLVSNQYVLMDIAQGQGLEMQTDEFQQEVSKNLQFSQFLNVCTKMGISLFCVIFLKSQNFMFISFIFLGLMEIQLFLSIFALFTQSQILQIIIAICFGAGGKFQLIMIFGITITVYEGSLKYLIGLRKPICPDQLNSAILLLEIIIGLIYCIKISVIGYQLYNKSRHTLFLNQQQMEEYEINNQNSFIYNEKYQQQGSMIKYRDDQQLLQNNKFSNNNLSKNKSLISMSTFQTTNDMQQGKNTYKSTLSPISGNSSLMSENQNNSDQKQYQYQIPPEEFFKIYEKCHRPKQNNPDEQEEFILGKGSSATVYKYKVKQKKQGSLNSSLDSSRELSRNNSGSKSKSSKQNSFIQKYVAIKITQGLTLQDYENCLKEVQTIIKIQQYPNIIQVYHYTILQQIESFQIFVAMDIGEYSLAKEIQDRKNINPENKNYFENQYLLNLLKQLINTLADLQQWENIAHRDIKPQNILKMKGQQDYKLADFGEAKKFTVDNILKDPTIRGTVKYLSPELRYNYELMSNEEYVNSEHEKDLKEWDSYKSDVFSLGLTMLEASSLETIINCNISDQKVKEKIENVENLNIYNDQFIDLLKKMLTWESYKRPTFSLLKDYLKESNNNTL